MTSAYLEFSKGVLAEGFKKLLKAYNKRVGKVETGRSLRVRLPEHL